MAELFGKYLTIEAVRFAYGHEQVLEALGSNAEYAAYRQRSGTRRHDPPVWARPSATVSSGMPGKSSTRSGRGIMSTTHFRRSGLQGKRPGRTGSSTRAFPLATGSGRPAARRRRQDRW